MAADGNLHCLLAACNTPCFGATVTVTVTVTASACQAAFLPWHRLFLANYDKAIREKCNYADPLPYWDWSVDSQAPENSPIWDVKAFGGNGRGRCIGTGPFKRITAQFPTKHCLTRAWETQDQTADDGTDQGDMFGAVYSPSAIQYIVQESASYNDFRIALESNPHNLIHQGVGGDMADPQTSVNDPVFFMHHRNLDRLWAQWQDQHPDLAGDYSGNVGSGQDNNDASLDDSMDMFGYSDPAPVSDMIDSRGGGAGGLICFQYSNSIQPNGGDNGSDNGGDNPSKRSLDKRAIAHLIKLFQRSYDKVTGKENNDKDTADKKTGNETKYNRNWVKGDKSDYGSYGDEGSPYNRKTPGPYDRKDMYNIRHVPELSEEFLRTWRYTQKDIHRIRSYENQVRRFTDYVNSADGFVSNVCLGEHHRARKHGWHSTTEHEHHAQLMLRKLICDGAHRTVGRVSDAWETLRRIFEGAERYTRNNRNSHHNYESEHKHTHTHKHTQRYGGSRSNHYDEDEEY
eukprot:jgi/Hompol1/6467/HPOL_004997-RA